MLYGLYLWSFMEDSMIIEALLCNALLVADWSQTRDIVAQSASYHEVNPILGLHPSMGKVNGYFAASILATNLLAWKLGDKGTYVYIGVGALEAGTVAHNAHIGLKMAF